MLIVPRNGLSPQLISQPGNQSSAQSFSAIVCSLFSCSWTRPNIMPSLQPQLGFSSPLAVHLSLAALVHRTLTWRQPSCAHLYGAKSAYYPSHRRPDFVFTHLVHVLSWVHTRPSTRSTWTDVSTPSELRRLVAARPLYHVRVLATALHVNHQLLFPRAIQEGR